MMNRLHVNVVAALVVGLLLTAGPPPDSPLADAAREGDVDVVRSLLSQGADVNAARGDGMTALHWAAETMNGQVAQILVDAGAILEVTTRLGSYTPLHVASRRGAASVVEVLVKAGADVNTRASTGAAALHLAAGSGNAAAVEILLDNGAQLDARAGEAEQTPLMYAAGVDRPDVIRLLLDRGADPSITTTLMEAATRAAVDEYAGERMQEVLDAFKGDTDAEAPPTPAQIQAALEIARSVQRAGVVPEKDEDDPRARFRTPPETKWGSLTALHHAAREGAVDAAMALVDGGADIDFLTESDNTSPLLMAIINGRFDLAMKLLERGADPNPASLDGVAPLYAAFNVQWSPRSRFPQPRYHEQQTTRYTELAEALLEAGADVNYQVKKNFWYFTYSGCGNGNCGLENQSGVTPFWRAARALDVDAMKLLVAWGADTEIATIKQPERRRGRNPRTGDTDTEEEEPEIDPSGLEPVPVGGPAVYPIHAASGVGHGTGFAGNAHTHLPGNWIAAVEYLIERGADVNQRDHNGYTPLHHAAARGDTQMIQWLVDQGADVMVVSREGQTTVDMANGPVSRVTPYPEAMALLESMGAINNHNCVSC